MDQSIDDNFVEFVAANRPRLFRTAYLLVGDEHRAEDIVQTALTKLYAAWSLPLEAAAELLLDGRWSGLPPESSVPYAEG
ncbi:MAG: sigma factor [Nocardioides sp.]|uniref:sigma factor n=1 Tax=Nocardioides sp. TaxID=35761 RepID=UPI003266DA54